MCVDHTPRVKDRVMPGNGGAVSSCEFLRPVTASERTLAGKLSTATSNVTAPVSLTCDALLISCNGPHRCDGFSDQLLSLFCCLDAGLAG
jgi:hypothetical protein